MRVSDELDLFLFAIKIRVSRHAKAEKDRIQKMPSVSKGQTEMPARKERLARTQMRQMPAL